MEKLKIKRLEKDAILPTLGTEYSAGRDLYACIDAEYGVAIMPGETVKIGTGVAIEIPHGYFGGVYPRSGLSTKQGLAPANKVGVIDSDYRGEVIVALHNHSDEIRYVVNGDRIAQLIVTQYLPFEWNEVEDLDPTNRESKGFGSTGK